MDLQFRCHNILEFDPESGKYRYCSQLLQADQKHVGLKVRCPTCGQMATVPSPALAVATVGADEGDASSGELVTDEMPAAPSQLSYSQFNPRARCPRCGSLLDEKKHCTACRYVMPVVRQQSCPIEKMEVKPAGFQLWAQTIMADGINTGVLETALHSLFGLTMLVCAVAGFGLGGANLALLLVLIGLLTLLYIGIVWQSKRLATVPAARLPFFLKPFWLLLLWVARSMKWQNYDAQLKDRLILDVRGRREFGDRELLDLEDLHKCEVLDAEGTEISDHALAAMHGLKNLRCLVLRKTYVSDEGVFRLQQAIPRCWIWY